MDTLLPQDKEERMGSNARRHCWLGGKVRRVFDFVFFLLAGADILHNWCKIFQKSLQTLPDDQLRRIIFICLTPSYRLLIFFQASG